MVRRIEFLIPEARVDVGHGQMAASLRNDPRVRCVEGVNIRYVTYGAFGGEFDFAVVDVSFISLRLVLGAVSEQCRQEAGLIALIKPQFELDSGSLNRRGVVKTRELREKARDQVLDSISGAGGWRVCGVAECPVIGGDGNQEFLLHAKKN